MIALAEAWHGVGIGLPVSRAGLQQWESKMLAALESEAALVKEAYVKTLPELTSSERKDMLDVLNRELVPILRRKGATNGELDSLRKEFLKQMREIPPESRIPRARYMIHEFIRQWGLHK